MLEIAGTASSPRVAYHPERGVLEFVGESYPENSFAFFAPIFDWFGGEFAKLERLRVEVNIPYMNSSSTKCMLDVLDLLEEAAAAGKDVEVYWFYESGNSRALDLAEEFKEDVELPFRIVPFEAS